MRDRAERPLIAITPGDPAGIGPEVAVKALARAELRRAARLFLLGDPACAEAAVRLTGKELAPRVIRRPEEARGEAGMVETLAVAEGGGPFPAGEHSAAAGAASHAWVEAAARLALAGEIDAMVTAPINKESWRLAGSADTGHQEVLQRLSGAEHVATMLVSGGLRCVHLSTHRTLAQACAFVTRANVLRAVRLTDAEFRRWGFAEPRIAVAALNPHAGDGGLIGTEELSEIGPAVADARAAGIAATGPVPADSVFPQAIAGRYDAVVAMYHDQGHIAIKVHGFEESVSVNLGLPFIRASVDHGTAFDIAGRGVADETSMVEAIRTAIRLARREGLAGAD